MTRSITLGGMSAGIAALACIAATGFSETEPARTEDQAVGKIGGFQLALLSAIERLGPDAYPAELARNLSSRLRRHVSIGQVFVALERLEDRDMVSCIEISPQPIRGGRRRKLFRLEEVGRRAVRQMMTAMLTSSGPLPDEVCDEKQEAVA
jgi:DNA-binding PadR family transcriptional regulator